MSASTQPRSGCDCLLCRRAPRTLHPATVRDLEDEFRRRAAAAGDNLAAETAWHAAADMLADAVKQHLHAGRSPKRRRKLGLRYTR